MVSVLLADEYRLIRCGLRRLLEDIGCQVVAEASDGSQTIDLALKRHPEIVIIDIHMPVMGGLEVTQKLRRQYPECRIIVLTADYDGPLSKALLELGVDGFLSKDCSVQELADAITRIRAGKRYIGHDVAEGIALASVDGRYASPFDALTHRELQVALMIISGEPNRDIAESLRISPKTVTTYRCRILKKIGARTTSDLLRMAIQYRLIPTDLPAYHA